MKSDFKNRLINSLSILALVLISFTMPIIFLSNMSGYYFNKFEQYQVYENFNNDLTKDQLNEKFTEVLTYLNTNNDYLDDQYYSREDILHLQDVKALIASIYIIAQASVFIIFFITLRNRKILNRNLLGIAASINLAIILIVATVSLINFDELFIKFHEAIFYNDYWLLDPQTSNLIKYLPQVIFEDLVRDILLLTAAISTILLSINLWQWRNRKTQQSLLSEAT